MEFTGLSPDLDDLGHLSGGGGGLEHEQDGAGGGDDKGQPGKKRRNRKPVTCAQCRKRFDSNWESSGPCGACRDRNEGHLCEWEGAIRLPQSNYTRDQEAVELRSQLDRLEGLLGVLSSTTYADGDLAAVAGLASALQGSSGARPQDLDVERTSAAEALGLLAGVSNANGAAAGGAGAAHLLGPVAGSSQTIDQILSILPHRIELDMLVAQFITDEVSTLPVIHVPSFRERYRLFDRTSARTEPFFVAFLFAVSGWSTYFKTTDPRTPRSGAAVKEGTAKTYLNAAMESLHVGGFMESPSTDSLRTLLILHHYYTRQDSSSAAFILSSALEVAHSLGLNRDPSTCPRFGFIECEERRRLWTLVSSSDWLDNHGRTYQCFPSQTDTLLPSNVRDEDVTEHGIITRPLTFPTPMLHLLLKAQIANFARSITDRIFSVQFPPSWAMLLELNAEFSRLDNSLPQCVSFEWVNGAVKPFEDETKPFDGAKVLVHLYLRQQCIRLHRPFLTRGFADQRFAFAREKVTWAARYTLAIHKGLGDDYRAARSWPLVFHALNALIIVAIDLYLEPTGGKYSDVHRADISASIKLLEGRAAKSKVVKETIRVVGVILRRSLTTSDKKRKHDSFLNGGYGGAGSSPQSDSPANLSYILSGQTNTGFHGLTGSPSSGSPLELDTILRPFEPNSPFSRPLPIPMSVDPLATLNLPPPAPGTDIEWTQLWKVLSRHKGFYALPDVAEWDEMCKPVGSPWASGIDLLC